MSDIEYSVITSDVIKSFDCIGKVQLVVSRRFAGDNRLSLDFLLVTTGCQQTLPII